MIIIPSENKDNYKKQNYFSNLIYNYIHIIIYLFILLIVISCATYFTYYDNLKLEADVAVVKINEFNHKNQIVIDTLIIYNTFKFEIENIELNISFYDEWLKKEASKVDELEFIIQKKVEPNSNLIVCDLILGEVNSKSKYYDIKVKGFKNEFIFIVKSIYYDIFN